MTEESLNEADVLPNPFDQFSGWYAQALSANLYQPDAMTLATATLDGHPSARMVLLKQFDDRGFVFYTGYDSRKGGELSVNPWAALVLYWPELHRQIRIEGTVERVTAEESDAYFASRPRGSQIAARASDQSRVLDSRQTLERRVEVLSRQYQDDEVPRPEDWGGYRVKPEAIEFWQGRRDRLHDRLRFCRTGDGSWRMERLFP
ncbi:MAG TPA: pyridoxamine 5'-phosphate oxidase [Chloroflexota bacterium]